MELCGQPILVLLISMLATTLSFATPLTLGALSGIACERSGVVNIAIEGMMLCGAFAGYLAAVTAKNQGLEVGVCLLLGVVAAILVGGIMSMLHGLLSITYKVDQIISGTVINILGFGATTYLYGQLFARNAPTSPGTLPTIPIPGSSSQLQLLAVVAIVLVFVLHIVLNYTAWGLRVRAVGEHPKAADTVGINVHRVRYSAVLVGGLLAGLGGAAFVPGYIPSFNPAMTSGAGFIALAAMILGKWRPLGAWAAALFFGFTLALQSNMQSCDVPIPAGVVGMLPYAATLFLLAGFVGRSTPPAADGVPY